MQRVCPQKGGAWIKQPFPPSPSRRAGNRYNRRYKCPASLLGQCGEQVASPPCSMGNALDWIEFGFRPVPSFLADAENSDLSDERFDLDQRSEPSVRELDAVNRDGGDQILGLSRWLGITGLAPDRLAKIIDSPLDQSACKPV
jgi:hypothetical protein